MKIYIPSRGRGDERVARGPASMMPEDILPTYVVAREEASDYVNALSLYGVPARVVVSPVVGIARKRLWIALQAQREGHTKILMLDDDIGFLVRKSDNAWNLRPTEPEDVRAMLQWIDQALDTYPHVSVSSREGNNRAGLGGPEALVRINTRPMRVLGYRLKEYLQCDLMRVQFLEDFDIALQLLAKGHDIAVSYWWAQGQRKTNEEGGCSLYRTHENHEIAAATLAHLHPGIVMLTNKQNKTDADGFGQRTEVVVQWKLAASMGKNRNATTSDVSAGVELDGT